MTRRLVELGALLFVMSGCASPLENAILELELALPTNSLAVDPIFAVVQVRPGKADFVPLWPDDTVAATRELGRVLPGSLRLSLVSEVELDAVSMKVRYCQDPRCALSADDFARETRVTIDAPFYLGEYSEASLSIEMIPSPMFETLEIAACDIRACSTELLATYCDESGTHRCRLEDR